MRILRLTLTASLFAVLAGCAGDPTLDGAATDLSLDVEIDREAWRAAEPGCEDVDLRGMTLASCEGEPLLGALIDDAGRVACVDSLSVLLMEVGAVRDLRPVSADPSPQPSHPGMEGAEEDDGSRIVATEDTEEGGLRPVSGRVVRADPTPTPITEALHEDPTPTPVVQPRTQRDPTPTPIMPE